MVEISKITERKFFFITNAKKYGFLFVKFDIILYLCPTKLLKKLI